MTDTSDTGADLFVDALAAYGVTRFFGNPGTTELPVMNALEGAGLEYRLALHEDIADAFSESLTTSGPTVLDVLVHD